MTSHTTCKGQNIQMIGNSHRVPSAGRFSNSLPVASSTPHRIGVCWNSHEGFCWNNWIRYSMPTLWGQFILKIKLHYQRNFRNFYILVWLLFMFQCSTLTNTHRRIIVSPSTIHTSSGAKWKRGEIIRKTKKPFYSKNQHFYFSNVSSRLKGQIANQSVTKNLLSCK